QSHCDSFASTSYSTADSSCSARSSRSSAVWMAACRQFICCHSATGSTFVFALLTAASISELGCQGKFSLGNRFHCIYFCRMNPPPSTQDQLSRRGWAALLVLCGVLFLDGLDVSMVGIALPSIERDLDLSTDSLQWIVSGYVLGYGGLLLLGG